MKLAAKVTIFPLIAVASIAAALLFLDKENMEIGAPAAKGDLIRVISPRPDDIISSPVLVEGEARGFWFFEASFPIRLFDAGGNELAVKPVQAIGEWMTEDFVPFKLILNFPVPDSGTGTLVLEKDNPSGLPEYADELRIPVRFR